jgi:hypothetical protein
MGKRATTHTPDIVRHHLEITMSSEDRTIDCEEDRVLRAVRVGMLREADRNSLPMMK